MGAKRRHVNPTQQAGQMQHASEGHNVALERRRATCAMIMWCAKLLIIALMTTTSVRRVIEEDSNDRMDSKVKTNSAYELLWLPIYLQFIVVGLARY